MHNFNLPTSGPPRRLRPFLYGVCCGGSQCSGIWPRGRRARSVLRRDGGSGVVVFRAVVAAVRRRPPLSGTLGDFGKAHRIG